jgi:hypothetical protein
MRVVFKVSFLLFIGSVFASCDLGEECVTNCDLSNRTNVVLSCGVGEIR